MFFIQSKSDKGKELLMGEVEEYKNPMCYGCQRMRETYQGSKVCNLDQYDRVNDCPCKGCMVALICTLVCDDHIEFFCNQLKRQEQVHRQEMKKLNEQIARLQGEPQVTRLQRFIKKVDSYIGKLK